MRVENEYLVIEVKEKGAELCRIYDKTKERELLWEGDPAFWGRHAPILFPNVGKTYKNKVKINGNVYPTSQHGFARDHKFSLAGKGEDSISFLLESTEEMKAAYPFSFRLTVTYTLRERKVCVEWKVENTSGEDMYFTIGGHPAFRFAGKGERKEDYLLYFPNRESLNYVLFDFDEAAVNPDKVYELKLDKGFCPMTEEMFLQDALIFDGGQVEEVWICRKDGTPYVGMESRGFPSFGIWSVKDAPFVCLEPWDGRCDNIGFDGELSQKPNVVTVKKDGTYVKEYVIMAGERGNRYGEKD